MIMLISIGTLRAFYSQGSNSVMVTFSHLDFKLSFVKLSMYYCLPKHGTVSQIRQNKEK